MSKQSCKTCKWAKWQLSVKGRIIRNVSGRCQFPPFDVPAIPACQRFPTQDRCGIWPTKGSTCPVYEKKEVK